MTAVTPGSAELLALVDKIRGGTRDGWGYSREECADFIAHFAAKPDEEGVRIPYDADARLGFVWLIWGVTKERVDLIAIATTEEACGRYLEAGKLMRRYIAVKEEQAFVDHLYGGGLLKAITNARLPVSTTGEPKHSGTSSIPSFPYVGTGGDRKP